MRVIDTTMPIYAIDLTHYLDDMGLIEPKRGPARKLAEFLTAVVAHALDFDRPEKSLARFVSGAASVTNASSKLESTKTGPSSGSVWPVTCRAVSPTGRERSGT